MGVRPPPSASPTRRTPPLCALSALPPASAVPPHRGVEALKGLGEALGLGAQLVEHQALDVLALLAIGPDVLQLRGARQAPGPRSRACGVQGGSCGVLCAAYAVCGWPLVLCAMPLQQNRYSCTATIIFCEHNPHGRPDAGAQSRAGRGKARLQAESRLVRRHLTFWPLA